MKVCSNCNDVKPFDCFYRNCKSKDGYGSQCKSCDRVYRRWRMRMIRNLRSAMWSPDRLERLADEIHAESVVTQAKPRAKRKKLAPNVALLIEQLVPRPIIAVNCEKR